MFKFYETYKEIESTLADPTYKDKIEEYHHAHTVYGWSLFVSIMRIATVLGVLFAVLTMDKTRWEFWVFVLSRPIILILASGINSIIDKHQILSDNAFPVIWS